MLATILYALGSVAIISLISLAGVFTLSMNAERLRTGLFVLVSLAVGALLGDAFIHLIPEAFETTSDPVMLSLAIIGGILAFFVIEKVLHWHHHQGIEDSEPQIHPVGRIILFSDGFHNFIDGLIVGLAYTVSIEVGIATTIAVILHEIPQEIGDFGVLLHAGYTKSKALWLNFLSGLLAIIGAGTALVLGEVAEPLTLFLVPITAGGFIYIALSDLIPELHKMKSARKSFIQLVAICIGVGAMFLLLSLEG
ncbi:MAG: zinc and cadmium transporter [Candidatus Parcubacteria bacterium]|jgi:zinc and cadmium transporter|nr:zinc and cadmium transporter [Candidatus Parcubacteria bacterium]